ncbi:MAG: hypothetical protein ABIV47_01335 [Roseiflexaceae bacterium]
MMATQKRAKHNSSGRSANRPNAEQNASPVSPAVGPTISVTASPPHDPAAGTRSPASPAAERVAMAQRRNVIVAGVSLLVLLIAFLAYRSLTSETPTAPISAAVPTTATQPASVATAAPAVAPVAPVAAPAVVPTAAPAVAPVAPVAAPAVPVTAPAATITCTTIAGLPLFDGATCTNQDSDLDDGVTKLENTYTVGATADETRRFYEGAFASNGWTLGDVKYDLNAGQRRASIDVDTEQGLSGVVTTVRLTEYLAAAPTGTTCAPIAGLPIISGATCAKFDIDQNDGVFKAEHSYTTSVSPEEIRSFYATALAENGWTGPDFQYDLQQGLRRVQVDVETKQGAQGSFTELRIAEK